MTPEPEVMERASHQRFAGGSASGALPIAVGSLSSDAGAFLRSSYKLLLPMMLLGLVAAYVFTGSQIPQYRATATLEVQDLNENFLNREVSQVMPFSPAPVANDIQTQLRVLQSGVLIGRTLQSLPKENIPPARGVRAWIGDGGAKAVPVEAPESRLERAARNLQVRETRQSRIVDVTFESPDASYSAAFANGLAQHFIEQSIEARIQISKGTSAFLEKQLAEAGAKMAESEHRLQNYARKSGILVSSENHRPDEERFRQIQESLSKAQENRMMKQARMETAASAPLDSLEIPLGSVLRDFQSRLADLRRQRAELASVYTAGFDGVTRLDAQIAKLEAEQSRESNAILQGIKNDYADAVRRERLLEEGYQKQFSQVMEQSGNAIQYGILKRAVDTNRDLYNNMLQRTAEAKVASALRASGARIVDVARIPHLPFRPNKLLNLLWGGTAGLLLGLTLAVVRRRAQVRVEAVRDLAPEFGLAELGSIPKIARGATARVPTRWGSEAGFVRIPAGAEPDVEDSIAMATWSEGRPDELNAFRSVLTSILLARQAGDKAQVVVVTSAKAREGKTTAVANLAGVLARTGRKVLLVDASRERRLHKLFEVAGGDVGLQELCEMPGGSASLLPYVVSETFHENVVFLGLGSDEDLVFTPALPSIVAAMRENYDVTLIDTPPVGEWPGVRLLSQAADGVVLVFGEGEESMEAALGAAKRLRADGAKVLGSVLNRAS